jgi:peptide/nickel transport system permease protein
LLTDALLAFPPLILLLALATVMQPTVLNIAFALALLSIPAMIRLARANTLAWSQREFILVAKAMGSKSRRIIFRDLLPNVLIPVSSYALTIVAVLIIAEASLSFLGLGIRPPNPSWGGMIAEGQNGVMEAQPHIVLVPGIVLFMTVSAFNVLGDKARKRFAVSSPGL